MKWNQIEANEKFAPYDVKSLIKKKETRRKTIGSLYFMHNPCALIFEIKFVLANSWIIWNLSQSVDLCFVYNFSTQHRDKKKTEPPSFVLIFGSGKCKTQTQLRNLFRFLFCNHMYIFESIRKQYIFLHGIGNMDYVLVRSSVCVCVCVCDIFDERAYIIRFCAQMHSQLLG